MLDMKIDKFLESRNINYLFLLVANLEVRRLSNLPSMQKEKFEKKATELALEHVVDQDIPDYAIMEVEDRTAEIDEQQDMFDEL
ncbi:MAG: hypothetical protein K8S56_01520 [Candidatus Cloacimonetes bacterium]|nr:hypothetical protein [Candidatus Cloacimonadota bacterium]